MLKLSAPGVTLCFDPASNEAGAAFRDTAYGELSLTRIAPSLGDPTGRPQKCVGLAVGNQLTLTCQRGAHSATIRFSVSRNRLRAELLQGKVFTALRGQVRGQGEILTARLALDQDHRPIRYVRDDVFDIGVGRASSRRMNAVYSRRTLWALYFGVPAAGTADLRPASKGYSFSTALPLELSAVDLWPTLGWRLGSSTRGDWTFGKNSSNHEYTVPREWAGQRRDFPWPRLSPVHLPVVPLSGPARWAEHQKQIDFVAANLRDYGFFVYGEYPRTQHLPEYHPARQPAWLAFCRKLSDYAHGRGLKVLQWVTDPDIRPAPYPDLHKMMKERGWLSPTKEESTLDYSNPAVLAWIADQYSKVATTGADYYWVDNNHPTKPILRPELFPPDAFRLFLLSVQKGLLAAGRKDILIRSGASEWADYSGVGVLDVYAPSPDIQNSWFDQQVSVATRLVHVDYLLHHNLWRRGIDDFFPGGPLTLDQTRAMVTLLGFTGIGYTTTDTGISKIPPARLELVRQTVPLGEMRPLNLYRLVSRPLPRVWTLNVQKGEFHWQLLAVFNWQVRSEQASFLPFERLGLDSDQRYLVFDFFSQKPLGIFSGGIGLRVSPTSARSLSVHPLRSVPFLVSTDRHVTQGAVDTEGLAWDGSAGVLAGVFTAGVPGRTFHLTIYSPPGWRPVSAEVGGAPAEVKSTGGRLFRLPLAKAGKRTAWSIRFVAVAPENPDPTQTPKAPGLPVVGSITEIGSSRDSVVLADLRLPGPGGRLLGEPKRLLNAVAASGARLILISPTVPSAGLRALQRSLGLAWGTVDGPGRTSASLTVGAGPETVGPGLLFRATAISLAVSTLKALYRRVGLGGVMVVYPEATAKELEGWAKGLGGNLDSWAAARRTELTRWRVASESRIGPWTVDLQKGVGVSWIELSPLLKGRPLSLHVNGKLVIGHPPTTVEVSLNGKKLAHIRNPCQPSTPADKDLGYFKIPEDAVTFGRRNSLEVRVTARPPPPGELKSRMEQAVELRLETPGEIGRSEMAPLPELLAGRCRLSVALGASGSGDSIESGCPGVSHRVVGASAYTGWPRGVGHPFHCRSAPRAFTIEITVPAGATGLFSVFAYDKEGARVQEVSFEGREHRVLSNFSSGKWVLLPFDSADTADGRLLLQVKRLAGANCVLSRLNLEL